MDQQEKYKLLAMSIERIVFDGSLPASFFAIPQNIYADVPFKLQETPEVVQRIFNLEKDSAEVLIYTDHNDIRLVGIFPTNSSDAYFGFWEATNDFDLNQQAFTLLQTDATARNRTTITGPINFNTFHHYRLRTTTVPSWQMFDREPVNPSYYPTLLEQLGFTTNTHFESRLIAKENIPGVYIDKQFFVDEVKKIPFDFIPLNPETWIEYEDELYELIHAIFSGNPFYKTISKEEFGLLYNIDFARKLCPHSSVLFKEQNTGRLAAISMCHPNYYSLNLPQHISPVFQVHYPLLPKKILLAKSVGVHPDFRKQQLMNFLGAYGMLSFREYYDEVLFCTMRSDNFSLHFTNGIPYEKAEYALYQKQL
jgi:hypothetical protein